MEMEKKMEKKMEKLQMGMEMEMEMEKLQVDMDNAKATSDERSQQPTAKQHLSLLSLPTEVLLRCIALFLCKGD